MQMNEELRAAGIKSKDLRHIGKLTPPDLKIIMKKVAEKIFSPDSFTNDAVSLDAAGKPCDLYSDDAVSRDLLGWILKVSYDHFDNIRSGRRNIGQVISMYIDSHIRTVSGEKLRLMSLGDMGAKYAASYLARAADALHPTQLPILFAYAKDYESEEDKQKAIARSLARRRKQEEIEAAA
jgi:hypothetical protein